MVVPRMVWPLRVPGALDSGAMNAPRATVGMALAQPDRTLLPDGGLREMRFPGVVRAALSCVTSVGH